MKRIGRKGLFVFGLMIVTGLVASGQSVKLTNLYSTRDYSIRYPAGWQVVEHLNDMTDVYIGNQSENFGYTIVRFETDLSLAEAKKQGNSNLKQAGVKILEDKQVFLAGMKCYRDVQEIRAFGQVSKLISYTFKHGNMLYNIKFGSVSKAAHEKLAADIVASFKFK